MEISLTQLLVGFQSALTIRKLADHLGVSEEAVRARLRSLTAAEEAHINEVMEGGKL